MLKLNASEREKYFILFLAFFSLLLYSNSLWAPFIFDDQHMISGNLLIKNTKYIPDFFKGAVTSSPVLQRMCRPLLMLSFTFNYQTGGLCPVSYHIVNIILHFLNATLIYYLLKLIIKSAPQGLLFIITLFFSAHPINTEAVTYVSSRSDLMVTFFILSSFILYLKNRYLWSSLCYVFALLSKETGLCFLFLVFGYQLLYQEKIKEVTARKRLFFLAVLIISLAYFLYKQYYFGGFEGKILRPVLSNILIQSWVSFFYLKSFLLPFSLNIVHYSPNLTSLFQLKALLSVSGMLILSILIIVLRKRLPLISLGIFWYLAGLLPKFYASLNFVNCEHHFYLSSIGAYIILAFVLIKPYLNNKRYFLYPAIGLICLFSALTLFRNYEWSDAFRLWKTAAARNPLSAPAHNFLGIEYANRKLYQEAEEEFKKAVFLAADNETKISGNGNLALLYKLQKNYTQAIETLKPLLNMSPVPPNSYHSLGVIYMEMGKEKEALLAWEKELELYPTSTYTYANLGLYYLGKKETAKARNYFEKAVYYNPDFELGYYYLELCK